MKRGSYTDTAGRIWVTQLPDGAPDANANMGLAVGPPSLAALGLPLDIEVRLHNELVARDLLTEKDALTRRQDMIGALFSAFKVDAGRITQLYQQTTGGLNGDTPHIADDGQIPDEVPDEVPLEERIIVADGSDEVDKDLAVVWGKEKQQPAAQRQRKARR